MQTLEKSFTRWLDAIACMFRYYRSSGIVEGFYRKMKLFNAGHMVLETLKIISCESESCVVKTEWKFDRFSWRKYESSPFFGVDPNNGGVGSEVLGRGCLVSGEAV